jgi:hypothetical protein
MKIYISNVGKREFLVIEDEYSIPVDLINKIDLNAQNGSASANSVCIMTNNEKYFFSYEQADDIREYLQEQKISMLNETYVHAI